MKILKPILVTLAVALCAVGVYFILLSTGDKLFNIPTEYEQVVVIRADSNEIRYPEDGEKMSDGYSYPYNHKTMYTATGDAAEEIVQYLNGSKYLRRKSFNVFFFIPGINMDSVKTSDRVRYYIVFKAADGTELYSLHTAGCDFISTSEEGYTYKKITDRKWGEKFDAVLEKSQQKETYWSPDALWFKTFDQTGV